VIDRVLCALLAVQGWSVDEAIDAADGFVGDLGHYCDFSALVGENEVEVSYLLRRTATSARL
jgi:hypothetical protein